MDEQTQIIIDEFGGGPLTTGGLVSVLPPTTDPRYTGLNRAQRRKAQAVERRAFKNDRP